MRIFLFPTAKVKEDVTSKKRIEGCNIWEPDHGENNKLLGDSFDNLQMHEWATFMMWLLVVICIIPQGGGGEGRFNRRVANNICKYFPNDRELKKKTEKNIRKNDKSF